MRGLTAILAVLALGSAVLWNATDGLRAFTAESARRLAVEREPRSLPDPLLQDQDGRAFHLSDYRGRPLLVQFIFTRCASLCLALGDGFARIAEDLPRDRGAALLSISFDPAYDGPNELTDYGDRFGADGETWRIARVARPDDLQPLLDSFGIVVVPDPLYGFQHNAAQHLVDREGRLARIFDVDAQQAVSEALAP